LFSVLWIMAQRPRPKGVIFGTFLTLYGLFRCFVEFFRQPDPQLGYIGGVITMGQILSIPMILIGIGIIVSATLRSRLTPGRQPIVDAPTSSSEATGTDLHCQ